MLVKVESKGYHGEYPAGVYWSPGEVRELSPKAVAELPGGLEVVKPPASKKEAPK